MAQKLKKTQPNDLRAINEALVLGSVRQHELAEASESLSKQLYALNIQLHTEIDERKQAQETLRASEERFRTLFELGPVGVYTCDASGVVQEFNARAAELWGRRPTPGDPAERFCGSFKLFRRTGSPMPHAQCPMADVVSGRIPEVQDGEVIIKRPDGSEITVIVNIRPLRNQHGGITGAINCFYDITERKRNEVSLRQSEERFRALFELGPIGVFSCDASGMIRDFNRRAAEMWGREPALEDPTERYCGSLKLFLPDGSFLPHDQSPVAQVVQGIIPEARDVEAIVQRPDGSRVVVIVNSRAMKDQQGVITGSINSFYDITARKHSEEVALHLAAIVETSNDAIISNTLDGMITSWNHGAERLFGYAAQEAIGKPITMLMLPDKHAEERDIIGRIERGERMENYETIRRRKDGSTVWVSLTASPLKDGRGKIIGASKIARDMTGRRRADEHRAILVAELNHRAKNSLAMVQAIASQTLSNAPSLVEAKLAFESRLGALARGHDLLTFGNWAGTDLGSVIKMAVEPHGGGENRFHIEGPVVQLTPATALTFTMAIHELCTNAAKYGALSRQSGNVAIMWQVTGHDEGNRLKLSWTEKGGPAVSPPTRKGFGSRLIERALAMELGGEVRIHYEPSGVVCKIDVPLPKVEAKAGFNAGT